MGVSVMLRCCKHPFFIHTCFNFSNKSHPELWPGLLQRLGGGVQGSPPVGQLCLSPLPALQKQCRPHNVEEGKNHTADILTGLRVSVRDSKDTYVTFESIIYAAQLCVGTVCCFNLF